MKVTKKGKVPSRNDMRGRCVICGAVVECSFKEVERVGPHSYAVSCPTSLCPAARLYVEFKEKSMRATE